MSSQSPLVNDPIKYWSNPGISAVDSMNGPFMRTSHIFGCHGKPANGHAFNECDDLTKSQLHSRINSRKSNANSRVVTNVQAVPSQEVLTYNIKNDGQTQLQTDFLIQPSNPVYYTPPNSSPLTPINFYPEEAAQPSVSSEFGHHEYLYSRYSENDQFTMDNMHPLIFDNKQFSTLMMYSDMGQKDETQHYSHEAYLPKNSPRQKVAGNSPAMANRPWICFECDGHPQFEKRHLYKHQASKHKNEVESERYYCEQPGCKFSQGKKADGFARKDHLQRHLSTNHGNDRFNNPAETKEEQEY
ncbi:MAG: hypothetical protein M1834_000894 [Cirrosporium novae-zelandiae]|nr:MAG: hypothetical protein M1834_000894 [Cirrosporium novae-zelandiae]